MNDKRRFLILAAGVAAIPLSAGCITASVLSSKDDRQSYQETVSSVLVSADGKTLAVIGSQYHYLFSAPDAIKAILSPELGEIVEAQLFGFNVDGKQQIQGSYILRIKAGASEVLVQKALAAGFKQDKNGNLSASGTLSGTRYSSNGIQPGNEAQKLRKSYTVNVSEPKSAGANAASTVGKILITPITLAADGLLILVAIPLLLIGGMASGMR